MSVYCNKKKEFEDTREKSLNQKTDKTVANKKETKNKQSTHNTTLKIKYLYKCNLYLNVQNQGYTFGLAENKRGR